MISCNTPAEQKGVGARRPDAVRPRQSVWAVVEPIPVGIEPQDDTATREREANEERDVEAKVDDITAELVRLLEERAELQPSDPAVEDKP
jgi:hypothetical protein